MLLADSEVSSQCCQLVIALRTVIHDSVGVTPMTGTVEVDDVSCCRLVPLNSGVLG